VKCIHQLRAAAAAAAVDDSHLLLRLLLLISHRPSITCSSGFSSAPTAAWCSAE
jgi:hypothetical protein